MTALPNETAEPALALSPPLPPRETHGIGEAAPYAFAALALLAAAAAGVFIYRIRSRRAAPRPDTAALAALAADTSPASVTRTLRDYLAARVPALHTGLTSDEIAGHAVVPPTPDWPEVLRDCDAAHYAGRPADDLAERAIRLVRETEKRLAEARRTR